MNEHPHRTLRASRRLALILFGLLSGLLLAVAATTPAHAEPAALTVSIGDGLDGAAVRARLAAELRTRIVPRPDGGVCDLPCLSVSVDGGSATVAFTPARGAPRARTVELGAEPAQWPVVIALLAGNVVRDEAAELLDLLPEPERPPAAQAVPIVPPEAELPDVPGAPDPADLADPPDPPDPPDAPPAPALAAAPAPASTGSARASSAGPEPARPWALLGLGFVPGLSTDLTRVGQVKHSFSLDLLAGVSGGSTGVTLSGIADIERGRVWGFQAAGVASFAWRVAGLQAGGVAAVTGALDGVQLAGVAAVAGDVEGVQAAGVAAVARGRADLQLAGVTSVAHGTANIQLAGAVNVARRVEGIQLAPINIARRVEGIQLGIINVGSADGFSFGLINIVPGGRADLEATVDTSRLGTLLFRHGGRRWHNVYGIGGHPVDEQGQGGTGTDDVWMYGLGFGPSWRARSAVVDLELIGWQINHGASHYDGLSLLGQLRLSIGYGLGPFQLVAGGALNSHISTDPRSPLMLERRTRSPEMTREVTVVTWPSAFLGLRI